MPKVFRITGEMRIGGEWKKFTIEWPGLCKEHVLERVYSVLGSRYKLKRFEIRIHKVEEISPEEVKNRYVKELLEIDTLYVTR
ncbi:MAG: 50S ribosomal protein LX [Thermoprotei archaeon]|nr:MAG: 50S ribosomal protein LX [Thermoprotei archaeon]